MPRARSARSDVSDADMDHMAENDEFARLQRQYRIMDNDRKAYCTESQDLIKKQRTEVKTLEKQREEYLKDLRLIESRSNQSRDEKYTEELGKMGKTKKDVDEEIEQEKKKQEELKAKNRETEKKINDQHKNMGGVHMSGQHATQTQKNRRKLESQLQLANNKFCNALEVNKSLRAEIDSIRVERTRFDNLYKKLDKELQQLKQDTGEVIDSSTQAYESREDSGARMILLKEKADKDVAQHNAEMKELVRIIDHDRRLRGFMNTKGKERQEDCQMVEWRRQKEEREAQKKKDSQVDSVESYEAAMERIKQITKEDDIDALVLKFIATEDKNFALFNYVNEQHNIIETLSEKIQQINDDIDQFKSQGVELEAQRQHILKELEDSQGASAKHADEHDEKHTCVMKILDQLRAGIESLFGKINCDRSTIDDMLADEHGVSDQNMIQYLGIVEERTNLLLLIQSYMESQKELDEGGYLKRQPTLLGKGPDAATQQQPVIPPTVGDEYDSDGSEASDPESRPFTRNELINKAMKSVKKREIAARKEGFKYDLSDAREKTKKKDKGKKN